MEIFISQRASSIYILDDQDNLMFRPLSKNDECINLDIDDFDYVEFDVIEEEKLNDGTDIMTYLNDVILQLQIMRNKNL